jgi:hypothetical protein
MQIASRALILAAACTACDENDDVLVVETGVCPTSGVIRGPWVQKPTSSSITIR